MATVSHLFDYETLNIGLYLELNAIRQYYWRYSKILPHDVCIIVNRRNKQSSRQSVIHVSTTFITSNNRIVRLLVVINVVLT